MPDVQEHIERLLDQRKEFEKIIDNAEEQIGIINKTLRKICPHERYIKIVWVGEVCKVCGKHAS